MWVSAYLDVGVVDERCWEVGGEEGARGALVVVAMTICAALETSGGRVVYSLRDLD